MAVVVGDWGVRRGDECEEGGAVERAVVKGGVGPAVEGVEGAGVLMGEEGGTTGVGAAIGEDAAGVGAAMGEGKDATTSATTGEGEGAGTTEGGGAGGRDGGLRGDAAAVLGTTCGCGAGVELDRERVEGLEEVAEEGRTKPGGGRVLGPKLSAGASEGGGGRGRRERGGV